MQVKHCSECGHVLSLNEILLKQLTVERDAIVIEISKITKNVILYPIDSNDSDVIQLRTIRTLKTEKVTYINNLIGNLHYQMRCEKLPNHNLFINYLINELTKFGYTTEQINQFRKLSSKDHENKLKKIRKEIHRIHKKADVILSRNNWFNTSGCYDPTAKMAIDSVSKKNF